MITKNEKFEVGLTCRLNYSINLPDNYYDSRDKEFPVILFLHGAGERGNDISIIKKYGIHRYLDNMNFPFVVISPQCSSNNFWDMHFKEIEELLEKIKLEYRVDLKRICVVGISLGAYGAWNFAMQRPSMFKSIVSIAGGTMMPRYANLINHIPTYIAHGLLDNRVNISESIEIADALINAGGNVKLIVEQNYGHELCTKAFENNGLYDWIISNT